jgi:peptide/nickel transport system permease protein
MLRFLVRRVLGAIVILLCISAITYLLFFAVPADPAMLSCGKNCSPETLHQLRVNMGLNHPVWVQYYHFMIYIFTGHTYTYGSCHFPCFGYSYATQQPVWGTIMDRFPTTLGLAVGGAAIFLTIGVGLGLMSAAWRGSLLDRVASSVSLIGQSVQIYFIGPLAIYLLCDQIRLLNPGHDPSWLHDPAGSVSGLLLPCLVMSVIFWSNYSRQTRSLMIEQLSEEHVRTARAKGMSSSYTFFRYALRGTMGPIITIFGIDLGSVFGGAMITEKTFGLHGLGMLAVQSVSSTDLPMLMGVMMISAGFIVVFNIIVDASYALIDPRVRLG